MWVFFNITDVGEGLKFINVGGCFNITDVEEGLKFINVGVVFKFVFTLFSQSCLLSNVSIDLLGWVYSGSIQAVQGLLHSAHLIYLKGHTCKV